MNEKEFLIWFKKYLSDKSSLTYRQMNNLKLKLKNVKIESNNEFGVALDLLAEALDNFNKEVSRINNKNNLPIDGILSKKFNSVKEKFNKEISKVNNGTVNKNIFWKTNN